MGKSGDTSSSATTTTTTTTSTRFSETCHTLTVRIRMERMRNRRCHGHRPSCLRGGRRSSLRGGVLLVVVPILLLLLLLTTILEQTTTTTTMNSSSSSCWFVGMAMAASNDDYYAENFDDYNNNQNKPQQDDATTGTSGDDDDGYQKEMQQYGYNDDDTFHWSSNVGFDGVSFMPVSCINYNGGHMIKFQLFDTARSYQCHFAEISTFVVSISHYMRAYFNYEALTHGQDFSLPEDAAFLNCNKVQLDDGDDNNNNGMYLYAKIGCMERATFTSTKLHLYTDSQCAVLYDDGRTDREHSTKGYLVGDKQQVSSSVSFSVPFYSCSTCSPESVSGTFNKRSNTWYDDQYISIYGEKQGWENDDNTNSTENSGYMVSNDDINYDDAKFNDDQNNVNYYNYNGNNRALLLEPHVIEDYETQFWEEYNKIEKRSRSLYEDYYDIGNWNMCQRIYKYGIWCDADCRALDFFRTDQWSSSDVFLLSIMCTFLSGMMLLIVAKRLKAQQKARMYGDDQPLPGVPPFAMAIIFFVTLAIVITLAKLKFVNETLVFAVVTSILLFVYMLKLTLFENRRPVLLAAPRHDMFDNNPLDDHLFD